MNAFLHEVRKEWIGASGAQKPMYGTAVLFAAGFLFHLLIWLMEGGSWTGSISWRKPVLFCLTSGLTCAALGWILARIGARTWEGWLFSSLLVAEVSLIVFQQWRGRESHFNRTTLQDELIFAAMGLLILAISLLVAFWTVRAFRRLAGSSSGQPLLIRHSILAALLLLNLGNLAGYGIVRWGDSVRFSNPTAIPSRMGEAGDLKLPHAIFLHGLQAIPLLGWYLSRKSSTPGAGLRRLYFGIAGYLGLASYSIWQALAGRAPGDPDFFPAILLGVSLGLLLSAVFRPFPNPRPA